MSPQDPSVSDVLRQWRELPPQGGASLLELCGGDAALYQQVLAALEADRTRLASECHWTVTAPPDVGFDAPTDHPGREWTEAELPRPIVPGYTILGYLGRGGWGVVFRALDLRLDRVVALKLLTPAGVYHPEVRERFTREARALARLDHPNVVPVYDTGDAAGLPYFTMKFIPGGTLAAAATRIGGDIRQAVRLVARVAEAVQYLHDHGIVHRDLKPANILLGPDDEPLVADFGMVKWLGDDKELTTPGAVVGTRLYMAPEQAAGDTDSTGPRSDVWSLGVILYELLAGRRPFDHRDAVELERLVRHESPVPLTELRPDVPPALVDVVSRCLAKAPGKRYPTAAAIADDLEYWARTGWLRSNSWLFRWALSRRRAAALGCLAGVSGLLLAATPRPQPPRSAAMPPTLSEQVRRGEEVVLIGLTGLPPARTVITDGHGLLNTDGEGYATLHGPNYLAVELSDEALPPRFELSAEVSPEPGRSPSAQFGVFAGRRRWPCPGGYVDRMVTAGVTGQLLRSKPGTPPESVTRGALGIAWLETGQEPNSPLLALGPAIPDPPPQNNLAHRNWFAVSLRIEGDRPPQATCQGVTFKAASPANNSPPIWAQILSPRGQTNPRAADPPLLGAGVGVYALNGTARFRNVRLKPY